MEYKKNDNNKNIGPEKKEEIKNEKDEKNNYQKTRVEYRSNNINNGVKIIVNKKSETKKDEKINLNKDNNIKKYSTNQFELINSKFNPYNSLIKKEIPKNNMNNINFQIKFEDEKIINQIIKNVNKNE